MNISCAPWFSCMTICELPTWSYCFEVELSIKREDKQCCFLSKPKLFCFSFGTLFIHHIHLYPTFLVILINYMHRLYVRKIRLNRILSLDLIIVYQFTYFIICLTIMNTSRRCSLDILTHVFRRMIFHFVHSRALSWDKKQRYVTFYFAQNSVSKLHFLDLHFPRYPIPYNFFWEF